jgi:hypothetical protein
MSRQGAGFDGGKTGCRSVFSAATAGKDTLVKES